MGEDVGRYGGCFAVSLGLLEEFGPERVRDTPLSESAFVGAGIGAALGGMRPIVEIMTVNFSLLALDQILNNAATLLHMSGGQLNVPLVIRMTTGAGRQLAAQHSHSLEGWYAHIPGLADRRPGNVEDARGMLGPHSQTPTRCSSSSTARSTTSSGELADRRRTGRHRPRRRPPRRAATSPLITYGGTLGKSLDAADGSAADGIDAEVIDLRTLRPLDERDDPRLGPPTHRAVVVDEGWRSGSISAEISARITERRSTTSTPRSERVCSAEVPMPYAKHLEEAALPRPPRRRRRPRGGRWRRVGEFRMPSLGADMEAGTVSSGSSSRATRRTAATSSPWSTPTRPRWTSSRSRTGWCTELLVEPGQKVPVGTPLAIVGAPRGPATAPAEATASLPRAREPRPGHEPGAASPEPDEHLASPVVRRFARSSGVDLAAVRGTGPHGRITHQDVQQAAEARPGRPRVSPYARRRARELGVDPADLVALGGPGPVSAADVEDAAATRTGPDSPRPRTSTAASAADRSAAMRRAIATLMARSKREVPHYYLTETFDLSAAQSWLRDHNAGRPVGDRLVMAALLAKATALAARRVPAVNGYWVDDTFRPADSVHLGVAVRCAAGVS